MLDLITTATELKDELKDAMKKWRAENPEPKLDIEKQPELPEPTVIRMDGQLLIIEVRSGELVELHIIENNATRKIQMNYNQLVQMTQCLINIRKPMKTHKNWKTFYEDELTHHQYLRGAWERQMMAFKESVKRRMGLVSNETDS